VRYNSADSADILWLPGNVDVHILEIKTYGESIGAGKRKN
jgi:hypothetical protein